jgi:cell division septum initiation protein DivIVA
MEELTKDKDQHISKTKKQIDDFLQIIDQYEEEADHEGKENEQMRARIEELEQELKRVEE